MKRNKTLDVLKGLLIILVILGHCIQYCNGLNYFDNQLYFDNFLFKIIYSFHMPLFMLISGYFYYFGVDKLKFKMEVLKKTKHLFLPILFFSIISFVVNIFILNDIYSTLFSYIYHYLGVLFGSLWFLWSVLINSIIIKMVHDIFKDNKYIYILGIIISLIIPNLYSFPLLGFMFPYFLIGYLLNKHKVEIYNKRLFIISIILFTVLICFYNKNMFIYTTGYNVFNGKYQILIDIYRFFIGIFGSYNLYYIIMYLCNKGLKFRSLEKVGKETMGIYIISSFIFDILSKIININYSNFIILNVSLSFIVIFSISYVLTLFIGKIPILRTIMLGKK